MSQVAISWDWRWLRPYLHSHTSIGWDTISMASFCLGFLLGTFVLFLALKRLGGLKMPHFIDSRKSAK